MPSRYGALVASHRARETTESGLAASIVTTVPLNLPSFSRPTERKVTFGPLGLAGLVYGDDTAIMLSASYVALYGMESFTPWSTSFPVESVTCTLVQRLKTESPASALVIPFQFPLTSAAVSLAGAAG